MNVTLFINRENHKESLQSYKDELKGLLKKAGLPQGDRNELVNDFVERYINSRGKKPQEEDLNKLTNFILNDDLTTTNKRVKKEIAFLSPRQYTSRKEKEIFYEDFGDGLTFISMMHYKNIQAPSRAVTSLYNKIDRAELTPPQKELIYQVLEGNTLGDIAEDLGLTYQAVRRMFVRAKEKIENGTKEEF